MSDHVELVLAYVEGWVPRLVDDLAALIREELRQPVAPGL
jgi:hypothetical protein